MLDGLRQWIRKRVAPTGLAYDFETFRFAGIVLNRRPFQGFLVMAAATPGMFLVFNAVFRGKWVPLSYQWYSALIGDVVLASYVGFALKRIHVYYPEYELSAVFKHRVTHYLWVAFFCGVAAAHMAQEWDSIGSWEQRTGPNYLYHNLFIYPFVGYIMVVVFWACWKFGGNERWLILAYLLLAVSVWLGLGVYDGAHQFAPNGVSKHVYANPHDPWHNVRVAAVWLNDIVQKYVGEG